MNGNVSIPAGGCVVKTEPYIPQETCLLKIELGDGTSQFLELTTEQAVSLGLNLDAAPLVPEPKPIKPKLRPKIENTRKPNGSIIELLQSDEFVDTDSVIIESPKKEVVPEPKAPALGVIYKIISPEELNLKPSTHLPRGRPKKRPAEELEGEPPSPKPPLPAQPTPTVFKNSRTRSGRITRPPKHIEKDFEKIVIKDEKFNSDVTTTEFEPLKTNNKNGNEQPLLELVHQKKKRTLPPEHRCPTCNKMYLGRKRMARHFEKYPDHGPVEASEKKEDNETWKFLVDIALRCNIGHKALKFCQELTNLIRNARTLSKFLFRPGSADKEEFYVDEILASALGLKPGGYSLNEKELTKDLSIYAYLDLNYFDETTPKETEKVKTEKEGNAIKGTNAPKENKTFSEKRNVEEVSSSLMQLLDITNESKKAKNNLISNSPVANFSSMIEHHNPPPTYNIKTTTIKTTAEKFEANNQNSRDPIMFTTDASLSNDKSNPEEKLNGHQPISPTNHSFNNHMIDFMDLGSGEPLNKSDILQPTLMETDDLHTGISPDFHEPKLTQNGTKNSHAIVDHLHIPSTSVALENKFSSDSHDKRDLENLDKHISLPNNLLSEVDELILPDVDTGHVTNMLDTSTSSDDIMNVDQFVNERFKNITEPEIDIPNTTSLSLDSLDLFHFHGT